MFQTLILVVLRYVWVIFAVIIYMYEHYFGLCSFLSVFSQVHCGTESEHEIFVGMNPATVLAYSFNNGWYFPLVSLIFSLFFSFLISVLYLFPSFVSKNV